MDTNETHSSEAGAFIRRERERKGLSLEEVAENFGRGKNWLSRLERGLSRMQIDVFAKLCKILDVEVPDNLQFDREVNDGEFTIGIGRSLSTLNAPEKSSIEGSFVEVISYKGVDYLPIPEHSLEAFDGVDFPSLPRSWKLWQAEKLKGLAADVGNLVAITVEGDEMSPTLRRGDCVLIDRGIQRVGREAIYAIKPALGDGLSIKRCRRDLKTGGLIVGSDNAAYPPQSDLADDDIQVIGRAAWLGKHA